MYPITPVNRSSGSWGGPEYKFLRGFRQRRPYNLVLALTTGEASITRPTDEQYPMVKPWPGAGQYTDWLIGTAFSSEAASDNAAYGSLVSKMRGATSTLGVTLGEHRAAQKMITTRSGQLYGLAKALVRRDFTKAIRVVNRSIQAGRSVSSLRPQPRDIANLWLEWSWGWRPMVEDIGNALEVVVDPLTPIYVKATARKSDNWIGHEWTDSGYSYPYRYENTYVEKWSYNYRVSMGCQVAISNPNVALANRLGLLDLPRTAWAVMPFSFVVDKYLNIGQVLGSLTDFYGFTITNGWTSRRASIDAQGQWHAWRSEPMPLDYWSHMSVRAKAKGRQDGITTPILQFRKPSVGSFSEAASYIALCYQLLTKGK